MDPLSFAAVFSLSPDPLPLNKPQQIAHVAPQTAPEAPGASLRQIMGDLLFAPQRPLEGQAAKPELTPNTEVKHDHHQMTPGGRNLPTVLRPMSAQEPVAWRLTDRFGTTWSHTDKNYLERFVYGRNATFSVPNYYPSYYVVGGSCAGGRCAR